jgi:hypothetical protein
MNKLYMLWPYYERRIITWFFFFVLDLRVCVYMLNIMKTFMVKRYKQHKYKCYCTNLHTPEDRENGFYPPTFTYHFFAFIVR